MKIKIGIYALIGWYLTVNKAEAQQIEPQNLDSIVISSTRIDLPFKENSRTITIISSEDIKNSAAISVAEVLQQFAGIDIRRRGLAGMQADLYIRGGGFDQTLLLIDGFKVEDPQTGHHTLNLGLPIDVIERIEIIKGPAARVYGQNAFTGAVNIITKKTSKSSVSLQLSSGSYDQLNTEITAQTHLNSSNHIVHYSRNTSNGYRFNTDFDNQNYFLKSTFNTDRQPIQLLATLSERKFGANGFYASPSARDQYEETQASLVGLGTTFKSDKWTWSPRVYWRRNQDEYVFVRQDPSIYRNLHISNKIGADLNASNQNSLGTTGFGVDLAQIYLSSNNLGNRERFMGTLFLEHRFELFDNTLDIIPGIAATYFSDFDFHVFPGIDLGYKLSENWRLYANVGYTYRIPTYTDLYYSDPTTLGNENLDPEDAIAEELGIRFTSGNLLLNAAFFNRDSDNIIDYVKENEDDLWMATNIRSLNTKGLELSGDYSFKINNFRQNLELGYTYIEDEIADLNIAFSRYSINSLKHQFTTTFRTQFLPFLRQSIIIKHAKRTVGDPYTVVDASVTASVKGFEFSLIGNNLFNEVYSETNLVPMPKGNVILSARYTLN
ncbi:TonB-dependent receptor plug domain-containing protein [Aegicerativicinus sediminis]|uniref:TonB-dependent receptor plug domain-containing protein n=1 Tax=Aegicerativicinus sediminis TaxID=2893202 RepID=UPI001E48D306|nr:TonB-dependent receptor [Aegicerativicinus sediminis]